MGAGHSSHRLFVSSLGGPSGALEPVLQRELIKKLAGHDSTLLQVRFDRFILQKSL